jgi:hypothetical protein
MMDSEAGNMDTAMHDFYPRPLADALIFLGGVAIAQQF